MKRLAALAAFKVSMFFKDRADADFFRRYSRLISADVTEEELSELPESPEELFFDSPVSTARYRKLYDLCGGDPVALTAVQLSLLAEMDGRVLPMLREGGLCTDGLTIEAAARIACRTQESIDNIPALRRAYDRVELLLQAEPGHSNFLRTPFQPDGRLAAWLSGDDDPDHAMKDFCTVVPPDSPEPPFRRMDREIRETADLIRRTGGFCLVPIRGERTSGRRFFARETARLLGRELMLVPYASVSENSRLLAKPWRRVLRELLLTDRLLCLCDLDSPPEGQFDLLPAQLHMMERGLASLGRPVFLTTDEKVRAVPFVQAFVAPVAIRPCSVQESVALWESLSREKLPDVSGFPCAELAAKMTLTAGQISRILDLLAVRQPDGPWDARTIFRLCYQVLDDGRYQNIRFVETSYTWEDLRLPAAQKKTLEDICTQVERQIEVLDGWGLRRKFPYGRSVSALFSGPPGTGKTMAAQVLAGRLGLELYKIDLSQVVDKYIGETEKRLRQVFDQAEKSNMILFFDEADAILGKRSEVKEAKDKYANTEVAYLLQRMEEYSGVVLMATNLMQNIDTAFVRRFRYHIAFTIPDEKLRRELWHDVLPDSVPQKGIDFDYMARQFDLSGSQIKNIALNACYRAAAQGGILRMRHLLESLFLESKKEGKVMLVNEFGEYGHLLYEIMEQRSQEP